jgi:hypothetical protein
MPTKTIKIGLKHSAVCGNYGDPRYFRRAILDNGSQVWKGERCIYLVNNLGTIIDYRNWDIYGNEGRNVQTNAMCDWGVKWTV